MSSLKCENRQNNVQVPNFDILNLLTYISIHSAATTDGVGDAKDYQTFTEPHILGRLLVKIFRVLSKVFEVQKLKF